MTDETNPSEKKSRDRYDLSGDFRGATVNIKSTFISGKNDVRTQNLRDFTVQIRPCDSESIVGTGMVVSTDGKIVTCAHVVEAAGVAPRVLDGKEVSVYFPQALGGEKKDRRAKVIAFFPDFDDDVVLLQLTDGVAPLGPERMPVLGTAEKSQDNSFRSYGYRRLEDYIAGWAHGTIHGHVEAPPRRKVQAEPVQLESNQINRGMSGSAVLDMDRNLVVGIISETWFPDKSGKDRDTGWAVDSRVLSLAPLGLPVQDASLAYKPAPEPKTDEQTKQQVIEVAQETVTQRTIQEKYSWNNAPAVLQEWTGRDHLLAQITTDWNNPQKHVTGLIGFGGEGKSSLARKWVENLLNDPLQPQPDGVFWWGFYENKSIDEFFENVLKYFGVDARRYQSSSQRAQIVGVLLNTGRYLFVLDGLEVMQHQEGDQYGLLQSNDLRDLLTFFALPDNQSFCLITSRAPLLDLMDYTTYNHRDVDRLSAEDGRALLRRLGVQGADAELNKVVADWDGHALPLSILAVYLTERFNGDIHHLADIPVPTADEPRYERVHRVLRRYDEHLSKDEREFLMLFSVFRLPVQESAFEKVFAPLLKNTIPNSQFTEFRISNIINRLVTYRLIRHDEHENSYTTHPLIRNYYFALFTKGDPSQEKVAHEQIKDYYLSIARPSVPEYPTLDDLKPLIEVVYHACQAGAYDEAWSIYWDYIQRGQTGALVFQLGAYDTDLNTLFEFFPNDDTSQEPQVSKSGTKRWILNEIGFCLMSLGRLREAVRFYERSTAGEEVQDWSDASEAYQNLAELHAHLGALKASANAAQLALDLAYKAEDKNYQRNSFAFQGLASSLLGDSQPASDAFAQAEKLEQDNDASKRYLYSLRGINHADHLRRIGDLDYARSVTEANLQDRERRHLVNQLSDCHRVLGDLDSDAGDHESARAYYESALKIARGISHRPSLIEALLARGRFLAKHMKYADAAFSDLNEALVYCVESGYRIYEADVRVALGWAYLASGEKEKAKGSAKRALQMSNEMGYHWGKVDAKEVLERIEERE